jgi:5-methylcytosine-specific restriction enzyme subunit McrC
MSNSKSNIRFSVFQNQIIKINQSIEGKEFLYSHLKDLQEYYGDQGVPFYTLIHNGVRFQSYVGVFQIGSTIYEVLPFIKNSEQTKDYWRKILSYMLSVAGHMEFKNQFSNSQNSHNTSIASQYFEIFLNELDMIVHRGLIKNYSKKEENLNVLKGKIIFSKQVRKNLFHKEKMYVRHSSYSQENLLNMILYKTLLMIDRYTLDPSIKVRLKNALSSFPKMPTLKVTEKVFQKIKYSRNSEIYKKAISISKLVLLYKKPGFLSGSNEVFSLMIDMNLLWKIFIYKTLKNKYKIHSLKPMYSLDQDLFKLESGQKIKIENVMHLKEDKRNRYLILGAIWDWDGEKTFISYAKELYLQASIFKSPEVILVLPGNVDKIETSGMKRSTIDFKILYTKDYDKSNKNGVLGSYIQE